MPRLSKALRDHLGVVIAERTLLLDSGGDVVVRIGAPRGDRDDWFCPYAITGLGEPVTMRAFGIDAAQALQLALVGIRGSLTSRRSARVRWFPGRHGIGFPRHVPEDPEIEEAVDRIIELDHLKQSVRRVVSVRSQQQLNIDERERSMIKIEVLVDDDLAARLQSLGQHANRSTEQAASDLLAVLASDDEAYALVVADRAPKKPRRSSGKSRRRRRES